MLIKLWLRELPAVLVLWLFTHLRQTGGLRMTPQWFDLYLLFAWLVFSPLCQHLLKQLQAEASTTANAKQAVYQSVRQQGHLYSDFVNGTSGFTSMVFEDGSVDSLIAGVAQFALTLIVLLLAPALALLTWLVTQLVK